MRLYEMESVEERGERLKAEILAGNSPDVVISSYTKDKYSFGDLEALGWAKLHVEPWSGSVFSEWYEYLGPNSITVGGSQMRKGDTTPPVEVDRS